MTREDYVAALKDVCARNWRVLEADRERNAEEFHRGAPSGRPEFDSRHREDVLRRIEGARTIGELALIMDAEGWRRAGMMHMLVEVAVPDLPAGEFIALASSIGEADRVDPELTDATTIVNVGGSRVRRVLPG